MSTFIVSTFDHKGLLEAPTLREALTLARQLAGHAKTSGRSHVERHGMDAEWRATDDSELILVGDLIGIAPNAIPTVTFAEAVRTPVDTAV